VLKIAFIPMTDRMRPLSLQGLKGNSGAHGTLIANNGTAVQVLAPTLHPSWIGRLQTPVAPHLEIRMLVRTGDLLAQTYDLPQHEIFKLPIDAARLKAREILDKSPQARYEAVVKNWRQLADGQNPIHDATPADWRLSKRSFYFGVLDMCG
jgi:hypothetical protein